MPLLIVTFPLIIVSVPEKPADNFPGEPDTTFRYHFRYKI